MQKLRGVVVSVATYIVLVTGLTNVRASVVDFEGTFSILNSIDGQTFCEVGSPCADAFAADTGLTPTDRQFAAGQLRFKYDTLSHSILEGATVTLSSYFNANTPTYSVFVSQESSSAWGCFAGFALTFGGTSIGGGGSTIYGGAHYCVPGAAPGTTVNLDTMIDSEIQKIYGSPTVLGIRGGDSATTGWYLAANGGTLKYVPEPATLALVLFGVATLTASTSRRVKARQAA